jgi:hypothetical protein
LAVEGRGGAVMYIIVYDKTLADLIVKVNEKLAYGWGLAGGVAVGDRSFCQSMVLLDDEDIAGEDEVEP